MVKSSKYKMVGGNGMFFPILGFASIVAFMYLSFGDLLSVNYKNEINLSFVGRNGSNFVVDDKLFYINGWNSYWFMDHAVHDHTRPRVRAMLQAAAKMGLTVCRTWAFNDGDYNALQISPGQFDERVFKALDFVIAEAREVGIRLLLSLVNNLDAYGGKTRYVKWAWSEGVGLSSSNDSFFYDPSVRIYFKNYVKTILTRKNTITRLQYRDDPTIFGWELINEPRCINDPSGDTLQDWIEEMSTFIKKIDKKHLLTIGLEGFYGPKSPKRKTVNTEFWAADMGVDFIRNSAHPTIDFASVHIYPDQWSVLKQAAQPPPYHLRRHLTSTPEHPSPPSHLCHFSPPPRNTKTPTNTETHHHQRTPPPPGRLSPPPITTTPARCPCCFTPPQPQKAINNCHH